MNSSEWNSTSKKLPLGTSFRFLLTRNKNLCTSDNEIAWRSTGFSPIKVSWYSVLIKASTLFRYAGRIIGRLGSINKAMKTLSARILLHFPQIFRYASNFIKHAPTDVTFSPLCWYLRLVVFALPRVKTRTLKAEAKFLSHFVIITTKSVLRDALYFLVTALQKVKT